MRRLIALALAGSCSLVSSLALAQSAPALTLEEIQALHPDTWDFTGNPLVELPPPDPSLVGARGPGGLLGYSVVDYGDVSFVGGPWTYNTLNGDHIFGTLNAFLAEHENDYDFLGIWVTQSLNFGAFYAPLQNDTRGLGAGAAIFDQTTQSGFGELEGYLFMNSIYDYNNGSDGVHDELYFGQELGHRWGSFTPRTGSGGYDILGRDQAHWSFFMESANSPMEGNGWTDIGNNTWEADVMAPVVYSDLDLYLMGFLPPEEVDPWFLIQNPTVVRDNVGWCQQGCDAASPPVYAVRDYLPANQASTVTVQVSGSRREVDIDDIIAANGERSPSWEESQRDFKMALIIMHPATEEQRFSDYLRIEDTREYLTDLWHSMLGEGIEANLDFTLGTSQVYAFEPRDFPDSLAFEPDYEPPAAGCSQSGRSGSGAGWGLSLLVLAVGLLRRRNGRTGRARGTAEIGRA